MRLPGAEQAVSALDYLDLTVGALWADGSHRGHATALGSSGPPAKILGGAGDPRPPPQAALTSVSGIGRCVCRAEESTAFVRTPVSRLRATLNGRGHVSVETTNQKDPPNNRTETT
ncbi:uncharacterized protein LOC143679653 [Tamandua tetradactyla]|uniref:uncharacterized protein LOC143679653 n=1 Tax=Tamandua tetradactyla TaxID=48850 RepID=UPI004053F5F5